MCLQWGLRLLLWIRSEPKTRPLHKGCHGSVLVALMTAEAAEDISQVQCLMTATAGWEVVSGHFYSQQHPDQVFNSCLFPRNTSGTFSAWCSNQPRPPYTSTKWGWRFRSTPFVSSRHSSRKESLTTAAMGPGRAGGDRTEEPSLQCLLVEAGLRCGAASPAGSGLPPASSPVIPSAWAWGWRAFLVDGVSDG